MKLNPEGVEKAARAVCRQVGDDAEELNVFHHEIATAALTAYFDHLKQEGAMREVDNGVFHGFVISIIRTDKE